MLSLDVTQHLASKESGKELPLNKFKTSSHFHEQAKVFAQSASTDDYVTAGGKALVILCNGETLVILCIGETQRKARLFAAQAVM